MKVSLLVAPILLASSLAAQVTYDRILHSDREPQNWLTYSGGYASDRYSLLNQINRDNVEDLQLKWVYHPSHDKHEKMEITPLVVDGVLYAGTTQEIVALDAVTGRQFWKLSRPFNAADYPGQHVYEVNKGLAIGGNTLFWATAVDCHLLAIDAKTGRVLWDKSCRRLEAGLSVQRGPAGGQEHGDPGTRDQ